MSEQELNTYKNMLSEIFDSVSASIGIHVMLIVLERSLWKTKYKYPEAAKISFSEDGIDLNGLDSLEPAQATLIVNEFVMAISGTLGRLIGMQVAEKLTKKLINEPESAGGEKN